MSYRVRTGNKGQDRGQKAGYKTGDREQDRGHSAGQRTEGRTGDMTAQTSENKTQAVLKRISKQECEAQSFPMSCH